MATSLGVMQKIYQNIINILDKILDKIKRKAANVIGPHPVSRLFFPPT